MSEIAAEDSLRLLGQWSGEGSIVEVLLWQGRRAAAGVAILSRVLPHSQKALLTLRDENGQDIPVTVSLEGAEWEYADAVVGVPLPERGEIKWARSLAATFSNGHRYVFGKREKEPLNESCR